MAVRYDEVLEQGFYTTLLLKTWTSAAGDHTRQGKTTRKDDITDGTPVNKQQLKQRQGLIK